MARKKVKIELEDDEGSKYSIMLEGNLTHEKVLKVFELMNLLDASSYEDVDKEHEHDINSLTDKILKVIEDRFPYGEFTSTQVLEAYEDTYNEPMKLSMISTYLARFVSKGILSRSKHGREWRYRRIILTSKH